MATSGSYDFAATRDQIITRALRILGVVAQGQTATDTQISEGSEALNAMVKGWQNDHVYLWSLEWNTQVLASSDEVTGTDSNIYTCIRSHTSDTDKKPITGSDYTTYWVQKGTTGGVWASSTAYSSIGDFTPPADTLDVLKAFVRDGADDYPLTIKSVSDYFDIVDKDSTGKPGVLFFQKSLSPLIYLYEQPDDADYVIHYLQVRALEDFDAGGNTPDFPTRWINPLVWNLAAELGPEYLENVQRQVFLEQRAMGMLRKAKGGDSPSDNAPILAPAYR